MGYKGRFVIHVVYLGFRWRGGALKFTAVQCARLTRVAGDLRAGTLRSASQVTIFIDDLHTVHLYC
jgi:hypothetical protein